MQQLNPANQEVQTKAERRRIPMSTPVQKLEAPDIPGYHLHWFNGTPDRIQRALDGGYEFVTQEEMKLNPVGLGSDTTHSGNTAMDSRVSITAGSEIGLDNQPIRMYLMKIKEEWWEEDQKTVENRNEQVAAALRGGLLGASTAADANETQHRYVDKAKTKIPDLFTPKRAKRP